MTSTSKKRARLASESRHRDGHHDNILVAPQGPLDGQLAALFAESVSILGT